MAKISYLKQETQRLQKLLLEKFGDDTYAEDAEICTFICGSVLGEVEKEQIEKVGEKYVGKTNLPSGLIFETQQIPEMKTALILRISGAIDAHTVVGFQKKLDQLQQSGYTWFILDMAGIKYVNSTGLGTLVNVADALETRGGGITLVNIHPKVKVVFDMLGLNAFFKIFSDGKEALNYFQKSAGRPEAAPGKGAPQQPIISKSAGVPKGKRDSFLEVDVKKQKKVPTPLLKEDISKFEKRSEVAFTQFSIETEPKKTKLEKPIPDFEKKLSNDAGRPGPTERMVAQSILLMKTIQKTIGLKFILIANAIDAIIETVTGYISTIYQSWKLMKSAKRKLQRREPHRKIEGLIEELNIGRIKLSRFFDFAGYSLKEYKQLYYGLYEKHMEPTFALKLALEMRCHFDEMKRDLSLLTVSQISQTVHNSLWDFLKSFLPNIFDLFSRCRDIFILSFFMKYSRGEIEKMYIDFVNSYLQLIKVLQETYSKEIKDSKVPYFEILEYERKLLLLNKTNIDLKTIDSCIPLCRKSLQRLIQMLCNPAAFLDLAKWKRCDIIREIKKSQNTQSSFCNLELEGWLTKEIAKALKQKNYLQSKEEKLLRKQEYQDFHQRFKIQRSKRELFL